ncbi:MAG: DUF6941 family protein [Fibrobacterota bacterium]
MNFEIVTMCDAATVEGGKINILGAFDSINAPQFPVVHRDCALAMRIRFESGEAEKFALEINFVDIDGKSLLPDLKGNIEVREMPDPVAVPIVLRISQIKFEEAGKYLINVIVGGKLRCSVPFFARKIKMR